MFVCESGNYQCVKERKFSNSHQHENDLRESQAFGLNFHKISNFECNLMGEIYGGGGNFLEDLSNIT